MKALILITTIAIAIVITSCSKTAVKGCTNPLADNYSSSATENEGCDFTSRMSSILYNGTLKIYTDEELANRTDSKTKLSSLQKKSGKWGIRYSGDTLLLTNITSISSTHVAFDIEVRTSSVGKYEPLKKYTTGGKSYAGRWLKTSSTDDYLVYFKKTINGTVTYNYYKASF